MSTDCATSDSDTGYHSATTQNGNQVNQQYVVAIDSNFVTDNDYGSLSVESSVTDRISTKATNDLNSNEITTADSLQDDTSSASQPFYPTSNLTSFIVGTPSLECDHEPDEQMNQNFLDRGELGYPYSQLSTIQDGINSRVLETPPPYFADYTPMLGGNPNYRINENELQSRSSISIKSQPKELRRSTQENYLQDLGYEKDFPQSKGLIESKGNFFPISSDNYLILILNYFCFKTC